MPTETILTMTSASIKYGPGATGEIGFDMAELGGRRIMVVTDRRLASEKPVAVVMEALRKTGIDAVLFADTRIEPTDSSLKQAIRFAEKGRFDGFVGVGVV